METKKQVWRMKDMCLVSQKVDFGIEVTKQQAIDMWLEEEYADILDIDIVEMNDNFGAE
jgi:hypothetical protein